VDIILNITISEKKAARGTTRVAGPIRMNIDARPLNIGAKMTKYHVIMPQEVRHKLEGATVFSEAHMGN
jgi:autotransporter translocation and assembly factor TamB